MIINYGMVYQNVTDVTHSDLTEFRIDSSVMGISESTITALVLSAAMLASLIVLLAGQKLLKTAILITISLLGFIGFFCLIHLTVQSGADQSASDFYVCVFPFIMAILCAMLLDLVALHLINQFVWAPNFIFGVAASLVVCLILRENFQEATREAGRNAVVELAFFDTWYWLIMTVIALIFGVLAAVLATSDGRKSVVVIGVTCMVGAYGVTLGITALANLYNANVIPTWSFWAIAAPVAAVGLFVQFFLTGNHAKEHRESTRRRIREASRRGARKGQANQPKGEPVPQP